MSVDRLDPTAECALRAATVTYLEVGATNGPLPDGYRVLERHRRLHATSFTEAADDLMRWGVHLGAGLRVWGPKEISEHSVVVLGLRLGPVLLRAPCRVVYVVDEPERRGFAYGTLPGHPESGEERFMIERDPDGAVRFSIRAFSRPASRLARLAGPPGHWMQDRITDRFLGAAQDRGLT